MTKWSLNVVVIAAMCAACGSPSTEAPGPAGTTGGSTGAGAKPAAAQRRTAREVTIPDGTSLQLDLVTPVASDTSKVEDAVQATLREAVVVNGVTALPAGTELTGTVTDAERSGRVKGLARVAYRFTSLRVGSQRYDISTAPLVHEAEPTKGEDAAKIGIGAGVGAAIGAIAGGKSGAAKGAAIGGGGGTGVVLATRGDEIRLGAGANVTTHLTAPLTVRVG